MKLSLAGRADLLRLLAGRPATEGAAVAAWLGFDPADPPWPDAASAPASPDAVDVGDVASWEADVSPIAAEPEPTPYLPADVPFWRAESFQLIVPDEPAANDAGTDGDDGDDAAALGPIGTRPALPSLQPAAALLAPRNALLTRLRRVLAFLQAGSDVDVDRLVADLSRARWQPRLPRRQRRAWGRRLCVIQDWSRRLFPYRVDQDDLFEALRRLYPQDAVTLYRVWDGCAEPAALWPESRRGRPPALEPGAAVLAMSDLGLLDRTPGRAVKWWLDYGRRLPARHRAAAILPTSLANVPAELARVWRILPWEAAGRLHGGNAASAENPAVDRLLALLSMAVRMEPGLLRAVRRLLPAGRADAGLESLVWQHPALASRHSLAATFDPVAADRLLETLADEDPAVVRQARALIAAWHQALPEEVRLEEAVRLGLTYRDALPDPADFERALRYFRQTLRALPRGWSELPEFDQERAWVRRVYTRFPERERRRSPIRKALRQLAALAVRDEPESTPPAGLAPVDLTDARLPLQTLTISQRGAQWEFRRAAETASRAPAATGTASPLGLIRLRGERIQIESLEPEAEASAFDIDTDFWADGEPPGWASAWGIDEYGPWAELRVPAAVKKSKRSRKRADGEAPPFVTQRLRWIPAGTFWMGSPEDEPGRYEDEGPRHPVTISRGFWLFDTPCTQALWEAVTGDNPSRFKSPTRPVEQVSWDDCQEFLHQFREATPGLQIDLPSEAEWEYACRAGTETASYAGPVDIVGNRNAPALEALAWYGGNSGVDFELTNGWDASLWSEKRYEFDRAGTHPVKVKAPNAWGLYDMLGNVLEWCRDGQRNYADEPATDPEGPLDVLAGRVIRGGACDSLARLARSAFRSWYPRGVRGDYLGFRCRVRSSEPNRQAVEPARRTERAVSARSGARSRRGDSEPASAVRSAGVVARPPLMGQEFLDTLARLPLDRLPRPPWAVAMDRDEFGLYAELEIPATGKDAAVRQRLRLIPPGKFQMGSPKDEAGRWDDEGPQHEVTISQAFWLFDTPCTQALWRAVTGKTPSHFKGDDRPVEKVSWVDCVQFAEQLGERLPGLDLSLPTEAEWEYACRAGTATATYAGDLTIQGEVAPELDPIAWYSGNSGDQTQPVRQKAPNGWGLYDTLGNVWEWCRDGRRQYVDEPVTDPEGPGEASAVRVLRGGDWRSVVRYVRAACRYWDDPGARLRNLGFRCRVRASELQEAVQQASAGGASGERSRGRSPGDSEPTSVARAAWVHLHGRDVEQTPLPPAPAVRIVSDLEALTLRPTTRPAWAAAIGRDRYGLWADLAVQGVTQRLRWIPPGRARLGSPQDEPGRFHEHEFEPYEHVIPQGFWLFDTPCTQALWTAVIGENPSCFQSATRPVEQVSWEQCQEFCKRLAEAVRSRPEDAAPGFAMGLPSEAEWEYACRAGTETASYGGPVEIFGENNAPALDALAWYGGNSGVDFELANGWDVSRWPEKQYEFTQAGAHPVQGKAPNAWGLYDMLGNVWEWCEDPWRAPSDKTEDTTADPASAVRVIRGGSWASVARFVRAASRFWIHPGVRDDDLGFRCRVR